MSPDSLLASQHAKLSADEACAAPRARTYLVEHNPDLRLEHPGSYRANGFDWRLYAYGPGHWCVCNGRAGTFRSETEAHAAGRKWLAEGRI